MTLKNWMRTFWKITSLLKQSFYESNRIGTRTRNSCSMHSIQLQQKKKKKKKECEICYNQVLFPVILNGMRKYKAGFFLVKEKNADLFYQANTFRKQMWRNWPLLDILVESFSKLFSRDPETFIWTIQHFIFRFPATEEAFKGATEEQRLMNNVKRTVVRMLRFFLFFKVKASRTKLIGSLVAQYQTNGIHSSSITQRLIS